LDEENMDSINERPPLPLLRIDIIVCDCL